MRCCVVNCKNDSITKKVGISYHKFPKKKCIKQAWLNAIFRPNWNPRPYSLVCSSHFLKDSFIFTKLRTYLNVNAVPVYVGKADETEDEVVESPEERNLFENKNAPENVHYTPPKCFGRTSKSDKNKYDSNNLDLKTNMLFSSTDESTTRRKSNSKLFSLRNSLLKNRSNIQILKQTVRKKTRTVASCLSIIKSIRKSNIMSECSLDILNNFDSPTKAILNRQLLKKKGKTIPKMYSQELRTYALTLNFLSPKAYEFVRETYDSCLPHSHTISSWYSVIDCLPGFTKESFDCIAENVIESKKVGKRIVLNLTFDEFHIRKQVEWDGTKSMGYVDVGFGEVGNVAATQILVFMAVCITGAWKIPVGYFVINSLDAHQKKSLILHCMDNLIATGADVVGITFDGSSVNLIAARLLGCDLTTNLNSPKYFRMEQRNEKYLILPDPVHMLKFIRNAFEELGILVDRNGKQVEWKYLKLLIELQENEQLHKGNKIKRVLIYFHNQNMKVRLAVQVFSCSVADALDFLRKELKMDEFLDSKATSQFIRLCNNIFDILNSRKMSDFGLKMPINAENFQDLAEFNVNAISYIKNLHLVNGTPLIKHRRNTGFIGFITAIHNINLLYERYITPKLMSYIAHYKLNQHHLELFFGSIRTTLGYNNNPTVRQFMAAYKNILSTHELRKNGIGNCIPQEHIRMLNIYKEGNDPDKEINSTVDRNALINEPDFEINQSSDEHDFLRDHDYMLNPGRFTEYLSAVIEYISGFVAAKLKKILFCPDCLQVIEGEMSTDDVIADKARGFLTVPSDTIISICTYTEKELRRLNHFIDENVLNKQTFSQIIKNVYFKVIDKTDLQTDHMIQSNHNIFLVRSIVQKYLNIRYFYISKNL